MKKIWFDEAREDYVYRQMQDKRTLKRISDTSDTEEGVVLHTMKQIYDMC